jgi:hypothetical protein
MEKLILQALLFFAQTSGLKIDSDDSRRSRATERQVVIQIQIAIFVINGPLSAVPANRIFMREATVDFVR